MKRLALLLCALPALAQTDDAVLRAMRDEMARIRTLGLANLDAPYFAEYALDDAEVLRLSASMGGLVDSTRTRIRVPRVQVRVGSPQFDNTNYMFTDLFRGSRYDLSDWPQDDNYAVLRTQLWLATDRAYKAALDAISRKRAALRNVTVTDRLNDFAKAEPVQMLLPVKRSPLNDAPWSALVRKLSAVFAGYPEVNASSVEFEDIQSISYYLNTTRVQARTQDRVTFVRVRAAGLAADGSRVRDLSVIQTLQFDRLPGEAELLKEVKKVADNVAALSRAPAGETYAGPVLFEGAAAGQLLAQLLGNNLACVRRPVAEPGRPIPIPGSEFEGRIGARVMPEWMDVADDATQTEWRGRPLFGFYPIDMEGVRPVPVTLIEKGVLKAYLTTRQPVPGFEGSNGHARLDGRFGHRAARLSNLFVRASETVSSEELKKRLAETARQRGKAYGMLVRKLDFPASPSMEELQRLASAAQAAGNIRPVSPPVLAYRVYPDGREELVRGLRFKGVTAKTLKDVMAASDRTEVFDYLDNGVLFALVGAGGYVANCSVIAPELLVDDVELERPQEETQAPPVVPPPPLRAGRN